MATETKDKSEIVTALVEVQKSLPHIKKESKANYGTYASLDLIHDKVLPVITEHGFAWVTMPSMSDTGEPTLKYALKHVSGESIEGEMRLYLNKQDAQGQGSAITYAKRYAICAVLGLTPDDDDDGQAAVKATKEISYDKSPEEPSRKVGDEPISNVSKQRVREAFAKAKIGGVDVTAYCYDHISKEAPTTEADADKLIKSLEVPF